MMSFNWADWVIIAVVALSAVISLKRGFIKEVLSLFIWLFSVVLSVMFHEQLALLLSPYIESPSLRKLVALFCLFIACLILGGFFNFMLSHLVNWTGLTGTDRLLGTIFGALRGVVVVVVLIMLSLTVLPLNEEQWWETSTLIPHFQRMETWVMTQGLAIRDFILPLLSVSNNT